MVFKKKENLVVYDDVFTKKETSVYINGVKLEKFIPREQLEQILNAVGVYFTVEFRHGNND